MRQVALGVGPRGDQGLTVHLIEIAGGQLTVDLRQLGTQAPFGALQAFEGPAPVPIEQRLGRRVGQKGGGAGSRPLGSDGVHAVGGHIQSGRELDGPKFTLLELFLQVFADFLTHRLRKLCRLLHPADDVSHNHGALEGFLQGTFWQRRRPDQRLAGTRNATGPGRDQTRRALVHVWLRLGPEIDRWGHEGRCQQNPGQATPNTLP